MSELLQPLPEVWDRGLAIVAHPDDLEYGAASAVKRWSNQGKDMAYLLLTKGELGIEGLDPEQTAEIREQEEYRSAAVVGVDDVTFLDFPDYTLKHTTVLEREITRIIRVRRPEFILTFNHHPTWPGGSPNSSDHIATGQAIIAAMQNSANEQSFPELADESTLSWSGIKYWAIWGSPSLTHAVDVAATFEDGVQSLKQHERYLAGLTPVPDPKQMLAKDAEYVGKRAGLELAVGFELHTF